MQLIPDLMPPETRVRLHELIYARASFLEAESYAKKLRTEKLDDVVTASLITSMAVAYARPFMKTKSPDGTKKLHLEASVAQKIDAATDQNLVKIRHEVCAHKDLSPGGMNIPIMHVIAGGSVDIHTLRTSSISPDECLQIEKLCLGLVSVLDKMVLEILRANREPLPAPGDYTISHGTGPWLVPLSTEALGRSNLESDV